MTVALLLAAAPDRLSAMAQPYRQPGDRMAGSSPRIDSAGSRLVSAGVRQVDVAMCADAADGLRAVAATARDVSEPVLFCTTARALATPGSALAALLGGTGTVALTANATLLVAKKDLSAVADAAEALAVRIASGEHPGGAGRMHHLSIRRINHQARVSGELNSAVESLIECITSSGVPVASLSAAEAGNAAGNNRATAPVPGTATAPVPGTASAPVPGSASAPVPGSASGPASGPASGRTPSRPSEPGLVAALAVAPLASGIARWSAARGLVPNALTTVALSLSLCAATWYASGSRSAMITGSVLLCAALPIRQARGRLAMSTATASAFGGWLDAVSGAAAEYGVYAGLAVGWSAAKPHQAWEFATAAMVLLAVRQMTDACYALVAGPRPTPADPSHRLLRLAGQSIALPAGERTLLIAVIAPVWGPRLALTVLIGWGAVALGYSLAERAVASRAPDAVRDGGEGGRTARSGAR